MPRLTFRTLDRLHRRLTAGKAWTVDRGPWTVEAAGAGAREIRSIRFGARPTAHGPRCSPGGFTLIELIVVVAIIGILATIAVPAMRTAPIRAREAALKEDLYQMRSCIDQFHADRDRYPASLDELVSMGYLRQVPYDPVTRQQNWETVPVETTGDETERESDTAGGQGIINVHSSSEDVALDGTKYSDW